MVRSDFLATCYNVAFVASHNATAQKSPLLAIFILIHSCIFLVRYGRHRDPGLFPEDLGLWPRMPRPICLLY